MGWAPSGHLIIIADGKEKNFFYRALFEPMFDRHHSKGNLITRGGSVRRGACRTRLGSPKLVHGLGQGELALLPSNTLLLDSRDEWRFAATGGKRNSLEMVDAISHAMKQIPTRQIGCNA